MTTADAELVTRPDTTPATPALERAAEFASDALAPATRRAYRASARAFASWCEAAGVDAVPASPATVAAFLAAEADAGRSASTLGQRVASIRWAHETAGHADPTSGKAVRATLRGIRRRLGVAPDRKRALRTPDVLALVAGLDRSTLIGKRDAALLLVGFASAMRRSELVALEVADLEDDEQGLALHLRRSKTDQEGEGRVVPLLESTTPASCPVRALRDWLESAGITEGRVFRSVDRHGRVNGSLAAYSVARIVKSAAERAGIDAATVGAHSLRAGFVTSAVEAGKRIDRIAATTGHRSDRMIRVYTRVGDAFADAAGDGLL